MRSESAFTNLPRYGSHAWRIALDKAMLKQASLKLKLAEAQQKRDMEDHELRKIDAGPLAELKNEKRSLSAVEHKDKARAKYLEDKARQLSDSVVKDLNVEQGKFNIVQWYKSKSARESTSQSTDAVTKAESMWKKAALDSKKLMNLEGRPDYRKLSNQEASTEVRLNIYRANVDRIKAKLRRISAKIHGLNAEKSEETRWAARGPQETMNMGKTTMVNGHPAAIHSNTHKASGPSEHKKALRNNIEAVVGKELSDEGGSPARFEELASSDAAVRKAERKFHTSTPVRVADMVYDAARNAKANPKVPLLERKSIFNW
ncbi:hypothetical protein GUITHDRAFT_152732 [Guillardia theta CCMP2712]|uniref:Uncharacterized protein n=2 Tax=Guillardia theta TaxID=55529 RepID=L1JAZ9_GUITC|nr:hypothetical protein GUITHDRAFT_152732 [Guillardia theta CCMP2712]EKX45497.1 hypothetical protein GUITHDRAFT_152732 [Guillardia theta CCMP2712]|eukprot:XP_005832477.1 hypothetical protein GUITHDRAFT_152732 [Guillardia theta CCMP2712]